MSYQRGFGAVAPGTATTAPGVTLVKPASDVQRVLYERGADIAIDNNFGPASSAALAAKVSASSFAVSPDRRQVVFHSGDTWRRLRAQQPTRSVPSVLPSGVPPLPPTPELVSEPPAEATWMEQLTTGWTPWLIGGATVLAGLGIYFSTSTRGTWTSTTPVAKNRRRGRRRRR